MKKQLLSILLTVCMILTFVPEAFASGSPAEQWIGEQGIALSDPVSRGAAIDSLWRAERCPEPGIDASPFEDLEGSPYRSAVLWALEKGITNGVSQTRFAPDDPVTRTQMVTFLYRAAGEPGKTGEGEWYSDPLRWAIGCMPVFGGSLPLSTDGDDLCPKEVLADYLNRWYNRTEPENEAYLLYTSDVHCGIDQGFGYAGLAEIRAGLEKMGYDVILVDDGDSVQGSQIGTLSKGGTMINLMNALHYDLAIPGNHEFDFGMDRFFELTEAAEFPYLSCNFRREGRTVFEPYRILEAGGMKIAFVGVTTPVTLTTSTPKFFQDDAGAFLYDFMGDETGEAVYAAVQKAADDARAEGADIVCVMGHMGNEERCRPWTYADVISHTNGIDLFFDGHSHDTDRVIMKDKDGGDVVRSACGTKMYAVGYSCISAEKGILETGIWSWSASVSAPERYGIRNEVSTAAEAALEAAEIQLGQVIARSDVKLTIYDPAAVDESGAPIRIVRRAETNLGDFCTDALRHATGSDIGLWVGGGIRTNLEKGDVTYGNLIEVVPFQNTLCMIEATGQQILDALEWGARTVPEQNGGFLQVSGISYEIDVSVPSGCLADENGMCAGIEGARRVGNVTVGGEPIDPARTYTVSGMDYLLLDNGDGHTSFDGAKILIEGGKLDCEVLGDYIAESLGGVIGEAYADPYGQGRITVVNGAEPYAGDCALIHEPEFGGIYITKTIEEFNALGFRYGDSIDIEFSNGVVLTDLPYYNGYYTRNGEMLLVAYPGYDYIKAVINSGDDLWDKIGIEEGMTASVRLNRRGKYLDVQNAGDIHYEDDRTLFESDDMFANFRSMKAGQLKENTLYRSASPCDNQHNRAVYADALMREAGVQFILNLADNEEKIAKYRSREDFACPYFEELYEAGKVDPIAMNMNYGSTEFRQKIADGFTVMAAHEGPYLIHCTEGKDRTGFVCMLIEALAGASWEEIEADYMITYDNYYGIGKDSERYAVIVDNVLVPMVESIADGADIDVRTADLRSYAERFLLDAGMTAENLALFKSRILD